MYHMTGTLLALQLLASQGALLQQRCPPRRSPPRSVSVRSAAPAAAPLSPPAPPAWAPPPRQAALLRWLAEAHGADLSRVSVGRSAYGGVGLFAARACAADELLFAVPDGACLGVDDALADPLLGARLQQILDAVGPGGEVVALSAFLAKQLLVDGTRGAWWPYVGRRAAAGTTVTRSW